MQKERSKAISILVDMETEDSLKSRHCHCQKIDLAHADLLYHKIKNILFLLCTPMVLVYIGCNYFFRIFFTQRSAGRSIMSSLVSLFFFLVRCGGRLPHHEVLGHFGFIFIYRLRLQNHQPNSGTKSMYYSTWIALPKPTVAEKSVASFTDQRESTTERKTCM